MRSFPLTSRAAACAAAALALLLAGCASGPPRPGASPAMPRPTTPAPGRDGPEANPPPDLDRVPDADPRVEPVRSGGPNKPYAQSGRQYVPLSGDPPFRERGLASWYGRKFHGRPTASGETYNMYAMTAAHPTLPIPSYVRVRNPANGREVIVRVNDRGPFHRGRIIDLSYTAALKLDLLRGVRPVEIERITHEQIRAGTWRREPAESAEPATALAAVGEGAVAAPLQGASTRPSGAGAASEATAATSSPAAPAAVAVSAAAAVAAAAPAAPNAPPASAPATPPAPPVREQSEPSVAFTTAAKGYWVQIGAFQQAAGAVELQKQVERELDTLRPLLAIFNDRQVHRLQAGPYRTRGEAQGAAAQVRDLMKLVPVIVERR